MPSFDLHRVRCETFVRHLEFHEEIDSTNSRGLALAGNAIEFPALVLANRQTAGRGRGNNRWWTDDGGLALSLLLDSKYLSVPPIRWPWISLTTGLAVAEAVSGIVPGADVRLKWPNDVFLNGRKVCGILVETASHHAGFVVIGIGLNVNNSVTTAPMELRSIATSLVDIAGGSFDLTGVLIAVLQSLANCLTWVSGDVPRLAEMWRARCYLDGRTVQVSVGPDDVLGVCQGIDDTGALLLHTESGVRRCVLGVVTKVL
jgi:BirA family biotin operon repressor/biotin-[acetyl-CoA-carboxylase] ligase